MSSDGEICLWDAQKMTKPLQIVKNKEHIKVSQVSASCFYPEMGAMLIATSKVFKWSLEDDKTTRVKIDQQHTVARDFLTQFSASLRKRGIITEEGEDPNNPPVKYNLDDESTEPTLD